MPEQLSLKSAATRRAYIEAALLFLAAKPSQDSARVAAHFIVEAALLPAGETDVLERLSRATALLWLTVLLATEPKLTPETLLLRVRSLVEMSERLEVTLGPLYTKLQALISAPQATRLQ